VEVNGCVFLPGAMKGKSDANNQHYQFTLTLFLIILMMSYLLTLFLTDTTTIRTFGKKHSFQINKYRRLRFTREVTEEGGGNKLFPIVDDNIDFRGTKTNIASPILDKSKRKKKVTVSQMDSFAEDNDHDIFIDEFLDNMLDDLGTTSGNEAPVEESSEEEFIDVDSSTNENGLENVSSEVPDYDLIEMFLDLILMVKIDETLSPSTTPNNIPDGSKIPSSTIPSSSIVTTGNASRARVVNLSTKGITTMIIKTSTPQPRLVQLMTTPKVTISQHSTFTTTKFKVAASHVESTSPLSTQTSPTEISHLPIRKDPLPGNVTEESSTKPQVLVDPKTNKSSVSTVAISATVFTTTNAKALTQSSTVNETVSFLLNTSVDASVTTPSTVVTASTPRTIIAPLSSLRQHQVTASDLRQKANREPVYTVERKVNNRQRLEKIYNKTRFSASTTQSVKLRLVKLLTTPTTISTHSTKVKDTSISIHTESTTPTPSFSIAAITTNEEEKTPLLLATQHTKAVPLTSIPVKSSTLLPISPLPSTPRFTTAATPTTNGSATRFLPTTITREGTLPPRKMENEEPFSSSGRKVKALVLKNRNTTKIAESISRPTTFKGISVRQRFKNYYESKKTKSTPHSQTTKGSISVESSTTVMGTSSTYSSFSVTESELSLSVTLSALRENKSSVFSTASVDDPNVVTSRPDSYENTTDLTEKKNDETKINNKTVPSSAFQTRVVKVVKEGIVDVITTASTFQPRVVKLLITTTETPENRITTTETPKNRITTTETPENSSISRDSTSTSGQSNLTALPIVEEGTVDVITTASTFQPRVVKLLITTETPENRITTTETPENSSISRNSTSTTGQSNLTVLETEQKNESVIPSLESSVSSVFTAVSELNSSSTFPFFEAVPFFPVATTTAFPFSTFPAVPKDSFEETKVQKMLKMENGGKIKAKELIKKYMNSTKDRPVDIFDKTLDLMEALTSEHVKGGVDFLDNAAVGSENGLKKLRSRTRVPNFKHKKFSFSRYYRNLKLNKKSLDIPESAQKTILSSLREQLTASVLGNKKLRKKANHEPVFNPRRKINQERFKNYYKTKIAKMVMKDVSLLPSEVQTQLKNELEASLTENLEEVLDEIGKKENAKKKQEEAELAKEEVAKKKQEEALKSSLKSQLLKILGN